MSSLDECTNFVGLFPCAICWFRGDAMIQLSVNTCVWSSAYIYSFIHICKYAQWIDTMLIELRAYCLSFMKHIISNHLYIYFFIWECSNRAALAQRRVSFINSLKLWRILCLFCNVWPQNSSRWWYVLSGALCACSVILV